MSKGIEDRDPLPPGYSQGDRVVHDRLCVLAPLGCPSPRASQVHPGRKQRRFIYCTCRSTCPQHAMYERCTNNQHLLLHHHRTRSIEWVTVTWRATLLLCFVVVVQWSQHFRDCGDSPLVQGNHEGPKSGKTRLFLVTVVHLRNQCCSLIFLHSAAAHAGLSTHLFYCLVMLLICVNKCVLHLIKYRTTYCKY